MRYTFEIVQGFKRQFKRVVKRLVKKLSLRRFGRLAKRMSSSSLRDISGALSKGITEVAPFWT